MTKNQEHRGSISTFLRSLLFKIKVVITTSQHHQEDPGASMVCDAQALWASVSLIDKDASFKPLLYRTGSENSVRKDMRVWKSRGYPKCSVKVSDDIDPRQGPCRMARLSMKTGFPAHDSEGPGQVPNETA